MFFGDVAYDPTFGFVEFHLYDKELNRILTEGLLTIGDRNSSDEHVNLIEISGIEYFSASFGVNISAHYETGYINIYDDNVISRIARSS